MNNATFIASYYIYLLFIMPIVIDGQVRIEITFFVVDRLNSNYSYKIDYGLNGRCDLFTT